VNDSTEQGAIRNVIWVIYIISLNNERVCLINDLHVLASSVLVRKHSWKRVHAWW